MRDRLLEFLAAVVADPDRPLAELSPEISVPEMAGETR
jgi:hypothetical protein